MAAVVSRLRDAALFAGYLLTAALFLWVALPLVKLVPVGRSYLDESQPWRGSR